MRDMNWFRVSARVLGLLFLSTAIARPALAAPEDFQSCDGYGAPNHNGDGMTQVAGRLLGLIPPSSRSGDMRRRDTAQGEAGIAACNAALADERLRPAFRLRRASLLRARGVHQLSSGHTEEALADFGRAEEATAAGNDPYYRRSFGAGLRMLRAYVAHLVGHGAEAAAEARAAAELRPFDPNFGDAAARLRFATDHDMNALAANLRQLVRYDPSRIDTLYLLAMFRGHWDEVIALHPLLRYDLPVGRGGYEIVDMAGHVAQTATRAAQFDAAFTYALAATGHPEEARTAFAQPSAFNHPSANANAYAEIRARWRRLTEQRMEVAAGHGAAVLDAMMFSQPPTEPALPDLMEAIARAVPNDSRLPPDAIAQIRETMDRVTTEIFLPELKDFIEVLPETESADRLPDYGIGEGTGRLLHLTGAMARGGPVEGSQTVGFASQSATMSSMLELSLLRAAEIARSRGCHGLLLIGRRGTTRSQNMALYGSVSQGGQAEIDVFYVDPAALPEGYRDAGWRLVDADAVWAALSPLYVHAPAATPRSN